MYTKGEFRRKVVLPSDGCVSFIPLSIYREIQCKGPYRPWDRYSLAAVLFCL